MPDIIHTGGEALHIPGLPEWRPGEVWSVSDEVAERLLSRPELAIVQAPAAVDASPVPEEPPAAEPVPEPEAAVAPAEPPADEVPLEPGEFVIPAVPGEGTV